MDHTDASRPLRCRSAKRRRPVWTFEDILGFAYTDRTPRMRVVAVISFKMPLASSAAISCVCRPLSTAHIYPHSTPDSEPLWALFECRTVI